MNYPIIVIIPKMLNFGYKSIFVCSLPCSCSPNGQLETKNTFALYDFYLFGKVMFSFRTFPYIYFYLCKLCTMSTYLHSTPFISSYIPHAVSNEVDDSNSININRNCLQTVRGKHKKTFSKYVTKNKLVKLVYRCVSKFLSGFHLITVSIDYSNFYTV